MYLCMCPFRWSPVHRLCLHLCQQLYVPVEQYGCRYIIVVIIINKGIIDIPPDHPFPGTPLDIHGSGVLRYPGIPNGAHSGPRLWSPSVVHSMCILVSMCLNPLCSHVLCLVPWYNNTSLCIPGWSPQWIRPKGLTPVIPHTRERHRLHTKGDDSCVMTRNLYLETPESI